MTAVNSFFKAYIEKARTTNASTQTNTTNYQQANNDLQIQFINSGKQVKFTIGTLSKYTPFKMLYLLPSYIKDEIKEKIKDALNDDAIFKENESNDSTTISSPIKRMKIKSAVLEGLNPPKQTGGTRKTRTSRNSKNTNTKSKKNNKYQKNKQRN